MTEKNSVLARFCKHDEKFYKDPYRNLSCSICHSSFQDIVILSKHPGEAYRFARYAKGADIKALEKIVIDSKDPQLIFWFSQYVKGADVGKLEKKMIESKHPLWGLYFAKHVTKVKKALRRT